MLSLLLLVGIFAGFKSVLYVSGAILVMFSIDLIRASANQEHDINQKMYKAVIYFVIYASAGFEAMMFVMISHFSIYAILFVIAKLLPQNKKQNA